MEITVLGAAREVGRSAFLVKEGSSRVLLDFGVLTARQPAFPIHVQPKEVRAILLTHAHLDHSGAAPLYFLSNGVELYATGPTLELSKLLIEDFIRISGFYLPFEYIDLLTMMKKAQRVDLRDEIILDNFKASFLDAGHIPGSATIILEANGKRLLYTGDINTGETSLLRGADTNLGELDGVITECTYSMTDHPPRKEVEESFVEYAKEVIERRGTLLVPAFSVGRAQEIACILRAASFPHPVYMDGMALKANEIFFRYQEYLKDPEHFRKSIEYLELVTSWSQRRKIVKTPCVIIAPAGMLVGGAAVFYQAKVSKSSRNAISLVAFQIPGTPGRTLLDKGMALVNGRPRKVKCEVKRFDFSSHSGRKELFEFFGDMKGSPKVLTIHGEPESCVKFAEELNKKYGFEAYAPQPGETYKI